MDFMLPWNISEFIIPFVTFRLCTKKETGEMFAMKCLLDSSRARQEVMHLNLLYLINFGLNF